MPANDDPNNIAAPSNRGLKAIVIILGILIVLAFAALVVGFFSRLSGGGRGSAPSGAAAQVLLPAGSKILQIQITTNNRVVVAVQTPSGNEVDIFDTDDGRLIGRIKPEPAH
jgi:hypothetical protein